MNQPANNAALPKLAGSDLSAIFARIQPGPEAAALLAGQTDAGAALLRLEAGGFLIEAARLASHALPKREAVWWACMCATHTASPDLPEADRSARETAELWVRRQTDEARRAAMEFAQTAGFTTPEAWAAVAAFWSGDSMSPLGQPAVPPAPHLTGTAVAGAVALAAVRGDASRQPGRLQRFLASAREIAAGGPGRLTAEDS
jgi:hypothetical protein